jgi:hypothetical protein
MGWTVIIEDEEGNAKKTMPGEFILSDEEVLSKESFRLLKYVDPYGDTTFNAFMFEDLIKDLQELNTLLPTDKKQIEIVINYAKECKDEIHTYLKFYGD